MLEASEKLTEASYEDIELQLNYLIYDGFLYEVHISHIKYYQRFLQGIKVRISAAMNAPAKESEKLKELKAVSQDFYDKCEHEEDYSKELQEFHILLEEYRISLFAQNLGTKQKVSAKRIRKIWNGLKWLQFQNARFKKVWLLNQIWNFEFLNSILNSGFGIWIHPLQI